MADEYGSIASEFMKSSEAAALAGKKEEIAALAATEEGRAVQNMLGEKSEALSESLKRGDIDSVKKSVLDILGTDAGASLAAKLREMMK